MLDAALPIIAMLTGLVGVYLMLAGVFRLPSFSLPVRDAHLRGVLHAWAGLVFIGISLMLIVRDLDAAGLAWPLAAVYGAAVIASVAYRIAVGRRHRERVD